MFASTKTVSIVLLWMWCCYCCCYGPNYSSAIDLKRTRHNRTRSSTARSRTNNLTAGMPIGAAIVVSSATVAGASKLTTTSFENMSRGGTSNNSSRDGLFHKYLIRKPSNLFRSLMHSGVNVVQTGMDTFGDVSSRIYKVARKTTARKIDDPDAGYVRRLGRSVVNMIGTGIMGMEQITDVGLLLGNIGTEKIRSELDGKNGNHEIFKMLIKYVGSKVGKGTKGSVVEFINDISTISTFVAKDEEIIIAISTLMERLLSDPDVCVAMVRLGITMLESSPSTSCLLEQLPLSAKDLRMVFDVFVGSNGQMMLKAIAELVSEFTTGPDTRAFLESILGMMSMFRGATGNTTSGEPKKSTSVFGTLASYFIGNGSGEDDDYDENDDNDDVITPPPSMSKKNDKTKTTTTDGNKNGGSGTTPKPSTVHDDVIVVSKEEEAWFGKPAGKIPPKNDIEMATDDEDWFDDKEALVVAGPTTKLDENPPKSKSLTGKRAKMTDIFGESDSNGDD